METDDNRADDIEFDTVITTDEELRTFASSDIPQIYNPARKELERRRIERSSLATKTRQAS